MFREYHGRFRGRRLSHSPPKKGDRFAPGYQSSASCRKTAGDGFGGCTATAEPAAAARPSNVSTDNTANKDYNINIAQYWFNPGSWYQSSDRGVNSFQCEQQPTAKLSPYAPEFVYTGDRSRLSSAANAVPNHAANATSAERSEFTTNVSPQPEPTAIPSLPRTASNERQACTTEVVSAGQPSQEGDTTGSVPNESATRRIDKDASCKHRSGDERFYQQLPVAWPGTMANVFNTDAAQWPGPARVSFRSQTGRIIWAGYPPGQKAEGRRSGPKSWPGVSRALRPSFCAILIPIFSRQQPIYRPTYSVQEWYYRHRKTMDWAAAHPGEYVFLELTSWAAIFCVFSTTDRPHYPASAARAWRLFTKGR
jgi:hypothetical protein